MGRPSVSMTGQGNGMDQALKREASDLQHDARDRIHTSCCKLSFLRMSLSQHHRALLDDMLQVPGRGYFFHSRQYQATNLANPSSIPILGLKPKSRWSSVMSAKVRSTSPGCIGSNWRTAVTPSSFSSTSMK